MYYRLSQYSVGSALLSITKMLKRTKLPLTLLILSTLEVGFGSSIYYVSQTLVTCSKLKVKDNFIKTDISQDPDGGTTSLPDPTSLAAQ